MPDEHLPERLLVVVRELVGRELAEPDLEALARTYAAFARSVAAFPVADLRRVEPPLRSVAGPTA